METQNVYSARLLPKEEYVNAGHLPPLSVRPGEANRFIQAPQGILVGFNEAAQFLSITQTLEQDEMLLLYSDGVTEAMQRDGAMFGDERLRELLEGSVIESARQVAETVETAVHEFADGFPQSDDLTLLAFRLLPT